MREMKDSGVEWIGEIPKDWELAQVRYLFRIGRGRVIAQTEIEENGIYPVFSSQTKNNGCLGYINTYDFDLEQITWTTDGANAGTVFLRNGKHNCTNVCGTLQPLTKELNLRYQKYALEHIAFYCTFRINGMPFSHQRCIRITSPVCFIASGSRLCHCLLDYP